MIQWFIELSAWWSGLSAPAQFFFLTPFLVALVALVADRPERPDAAPAPRDTSVWQRDTIEG